MPTPASSHIAANLAVYARTYVSTVPDMSNFYEQHKSVQPFLIADPEADMSKELYQSKEDRAKLDGLFE